MTNAQHSSASDLWYTPPIIIGCAHRVLGAIDLDPASDAEANKAVGAKLYMSEQGDRWGLWPANQRVFLNPPGGKVGNTSRAYLFWEALMLYREHGFLRHAIFIAFSLEALQSTQGKDVPSIMSFPFCVPPMRLRFVSPSGVKKAPTHANAIVYVPGTVDATQRFLHEFEGGLGWMCKR